MLRQSLLGNQHSNENVHSTVADVDDRVGQFAHPPDQVRLFLYILGLTQDAFEQQVT